MKNKCLICKLLLLWLLPGILFSQQPYTIDASITHQTIANFGASDAWTTQFFGHFPDERRNQMADWLFSMETDAAGQPKGIGLSLWRFKIGAGSASQGAESFIPDIKRRAESFQLPDGTYDWSRHSGQQWFLQAAKERGVERFLAFSKSPPIHMTINGLANNRGRPSDGTVNLRPDQFEAFADFLATVVDELGRRNGITFQYLSPFNEPEWDWSGRTTQEGTPALMSEIADLVRILDRKLSERVLNTQILVTESGQIDFLIREYRLPGRANQIETFFSPASPNYIGNLTHVPRKMVAHSYWTTTRNQLYPLRRALRNRLDEFGLDFWQTELCIMSNDYEIGGGWGRDLTMKTALYVARIIHHDLTVANASAWHWWLAMTGYDYKDGLVYVIANNDLTDGEIMYSKLMWTLGNFSRFVRPGAKRVEVSNAYRNVNDLDGLMVSAFIHDEDKQLVIVAINYSDEPQDIDFQFKNTTVNSFIPFITSDTEGDNLRPGNPHPANETFQIPARAVVTFVGNVL